MSFEDALMAATNVENRFRGMQRSPNMYRPSVATYGRRDKSDRMSDLDSGGSVRNDVDHVDYERRVEDLEQGKYLSKTEAFLERGKKIQDEPFLKIMEIVLPEDVFQSLNDPDKVYTFDDFVKDITEEEKNEVSFALLLPDHIDDDDDVNVRRVKPILKDIYKQMMKAGRRGMNTYIQNLFNKMEHQRSGANSGMNLSQRNMTRWCLYVHLEAITMFLKENGDEKLSARTAQEIEELTVVLGPSKVLPHLKQAMKIAGMGSMMVKVQNFCQTYWKLAQKEWASKFVVEETETPTQPHLTDVEKGECTSKLNKLLCSRVLSESEIGTGKTSSFPYQVRKGSTKSTPKWENTFLIPYERDSTDSKRFTWQMLLETHKSELEDLVKDAAVKVASRVVSSTLNTS